MTRQEQKLITQEKKEQQKQITQEKKEQTKLTKAIYDYFKKNKIVLWK